MLNKANRDIDSMILRLKRDEILIPKNCPCEIGQNSFDHPKELLTFNLKDEVNFFDERQKSMLTYSDEFCPDTVHQRYCYSNEGVHSSKLRAGQNRQGYDNRMSPGRFVDGGSYRESHTDHDKSNGPRSNVTIDTKRSNTHTESKNGSGTIIEKKRTKIGMEKSNRCTRIIRSDESYRDHLMTIEDSMDIAQAMYPGVNCGHKDCLREPVITPKHMGWLWSLRETGGVKINRNWKPGAIPDCVAKVMEDAKRGITGNMRRHKMTSTSVGSASKVSSWMHMDTVNSLRNSAVTFDDRTTSNNNSNGPIINNAYYNSKNVDNDNSESNYGGNGRNGITSKKTNTLGPNNSGNKSNTFKKAKTLFSVNKHGGQYGIKMNPLPVQRKNGEMVLPKGVEPVRVNLGRCFGRSTATTSQSSMSFELAPQYEPAK